MFADVQDSGDPDCEAWKKRVEDAQRKLNAIGEKMKKAEIYFNETEEKYENDQKKSCNMKCEASMSCCYNCMLYTAIMKKH